jgi:hypothetical protein
MVPSSLTTPIPILLAELSNPIAIILPAILCTFPAHTNLTPTLPLRAISFKTAKTNSAREQGERTQRASAQASATEELGLGQA